MSREEQYENVSIATSKALLKCWKDAKWVKQMMKARKPGYETRDLRQQTLTAESYGVPVETWLAMNHNERKMYAYRHRRVKVVDNVRAQRKRMEVSAAKVGLSFEEYYLCSDAERMRLRDELKSLEGGPNSNAGKA